MSDVHLGARFGRKDRARRLAALLRSLPDEVEDLVLGGDIFEFWMEWGELIPSWGLELAWILGHLPEREDLRIHWLPGNHDFSVPRALANRLNLRHHREGFAVALNDGIWLFHHGDVLAPSDRGHHLARSVLHARTSQWLWRRLPTTFALWAALRTGATSRSMNPGPSRHLAEYAATAKAWGTALGLRGLVHGHTHRPLIEDVGGFAYVNNGDWLKELWCVRLDGRGAHLIDGGCTGPTGD